MKKYLSRIGVAALSLTMLLGLCACGGTTDEGAANAGGEGEKTKLYVVNWKDYGSDDQELIAAFEEEYNCEIVNSYMESEEQLLTSLKTASEGEIDVCLPNCTILPAAIEAGLLMEIDPAQMENFSSLYERFQTQEECFGEDGKMYAVPFVWGSTAIAYNTELMDAAPASMADLFDEQYAGKVTIRDDYNDAIMAAAIVLGQDPTEPNDLDAIRDLLIQQKSLNRTYWQTGDEFSKLFAGGQIEFGMMWSGQAASMKQEGEPIGFVVPEDGAIGWVDNWAIASGSQNKDLALAFINYMISKDVQYAWADKGGPAPANQEAAEAIDPEYAASCGMDEASLNRLYFMAYQDDATKTAWAELWTEVKAS